MEAKTAQRLSMGDLSWVRAVLPTTTTTAFRGERPGRPDRPESARSGPAGQCAEFSTQDRPTGGRATALRWVVVSRTVRSGPGLGHPAGVRQADERRGTAGGPQVPSRGVESEELRAAAASLERTAESNAAQIRALEGQVPRCDGHGPRRGGRGLQSGLGDRLCFEHLHGTGQRQYSHRTADATDTSTA